MWQKYSLESRSRGFCKASRRNWSTWLMTSSGKLLPDARDGGGGGAERVGAEPSWSSSWALESLSLLEESINLLTDSSRSATSQDSEAPKSSMGGISQGPQRERRLNSTGQGNVIGRDPKLRRKPGWSSGLGIRLKGCGESLGLVEKGRGGGRTKTMTKMRRPKEEEEE